MTSPSPVSANPAGRLRSTLNAASELATGENAVSMWAQVFGVDQSDRARIYTRFGHLIGLADTTRSMIEGILGQQAATEPGGPLEHFPKVEGLLRSFENIGTAQHMAQFMTDYDALARSSLSYCETVLRYNQPAWTFPPEELQKIRDAAAVFRAVVDAASVDAASRAWFDAILSDLDDACGEVSIDGPAPVIRVMDQLRGGIQRQPALFERLRDSDLGKNLGILDSIVGKAIERSMAVYGALTAFGVLGSAEPPALNPPTSYVVIQGSVADPVEYGGIIQIPAPADTSADNGG